MSKTTHSESALPNARTEFATQRYYKGYKKNPRHGFEIRGTGLSNATDRDELLLAILKSQAADQDDFVRLESLNTTLIYDFFPKSGSNPTPRPGRLNYSEYTAPVPHAAMSLELQVRTAVCNEPGKWIHIICESHEERVLLADHLMPTGVLVYGPRASSCVSNYQAIFGIGFVDRTLVFDDEFAVRRSRIGSQLTNDRQWTKLMRPKIAQLKAESVQQSAMTPQQTVDHCLKLHPQCPQVEMYKAVNVAFELRNLRQKECWQGQDPVAPRHLEAIACLLSNGYSVEDALRVSVVNRYPESHQFEISRIVRTQLGLE